MIGEWQHREGSSPINFMLSVCYAALGDKDQAFAILEKNFPATTRCCYGRTRCRSSTRCAVIQGSPRSYRTWALRADFGFSSSRFSAMWVNAPHRQSPLDAFLGGDLIGCTEERSVAANIRSRELEHLDKRDLHDLADGLILCDREAIDRCVEFILAETKGCWHGRARAMMCRRLKHCDIVPEQRRQLVDCIMNRLASGNFSEQFRDQLRLAIHLDPERTFKLAHTRLASPSKGHVRRFAQWVAKHEQSA
jgi:hypothetical protein